MTSMITIPTARWQPMLDALADQITADGILRDQTWREVFTAVPRHVFVPGFYTASDPPRWIDSTDSDWLTSIYSDETLATQALPVLGQPENRYVTSSSTRPGYMLWMLHLLEATNGMTALEIGTGTGYNAALLSRRLGDQQVTSIDIDPTLVGLARQRLAQAGYHPVLAAHDGARGCPERAPYDRIIATVALARIPYVWVRQTRPGGVILADLRPPGMIRAGAIVKLTVRSDGTASGRLIDGGAGFMSARTDAAYTAAPEVPAIDKTTVHQRDSALDGGALDEPALAFALWQHLPGISVFPRPDRVMLTTPDGSWVEATRTTPAYITHGGPQDIWHAVERTAQDWQAHGKPGLDAYKITVTPDDQHITLDQPSPTTQ